MEAKFDRLKKANLKTLKGPAKDRHIKKINLLKAEIDAARGNISSKSPTLKPSLLNNRKALSMIFNLLFDFVGLSL